MEERVTYEGTFSFFFSWKLYLDIIFMFKGKAGLLDVQIDKLKTQEKHMHVYWDFPPSSEVISTSVFACSSGLLPLRARIHPSEKPA